MEIFDSYELTKDRAQYSLDVRVLHNGLAHGPPGPVHPGQLAVLARLARVAEELHRHVDETGAGAQVPADAEPLPLVGSDPEARGLMFTLSEAGG